jgi:uncharacterized protein (DUF2235 family)
MSGVGGRGRLLKAWKKLVENFARGDTVIDIVGFSRGAGVAIEFAEWTRSKKAKGHGVPRPVRFLGLWDTVYSFGLPGNSVNIGWHMSLPDNVEKCFHALALDERRRTFPLTRLSARVADAGQDGRLYEVWFRGVHSDVGGGNRNEGLSNISLCFMLAAAARCGIEIAPEVAGYYGERRDPDAPISIHELDPIKNRFRVVRWNDQVHVSVRPRPDGGKRRHNTPPTGVAVVDDDGAVLSTGFGE